MILQQFFKQKMGRLKERFYQWLLAVENPLYYAGSQTALPPPLTRTEENKLCYALQDEKKSRAAREKLIVHNLRLVVYIARKFESSGVSLDDLISIGTIGLIKAVETFSPEKNIKLATYASRCIENEILMYLRKNASHRGDISIEEPLNVDWDGNELLLSDLLGTDPETVTSPVENQAELQTLYRCMEQLQKRDRYIICSRFGLFGSREHTQKEVADSMGISQSYISRLEKKILKRLRTALGGG